ncbi:MAG: YwiC-like family protein [Gemmatimonadetes bacterium]|uniref:YwiC-like family protein n=1 Tax=Candidatus Kutchimonas denitrificans TaxID=3056748 RepID=A0AAE4Z5B6_9BACT|nr:YwiC-like family protein [Gemmatimonadota bacterium]NIR74064.1 YwiC-like family protein [Candidatus Kutchimonas denitrificans]NIS01626.1 YwiC-like family protein [Gemmatimonadota bacterium]NIT67364.1 YwiC-like family protein [Gemmatimonadota bacterium]NIU52727.1 hypothetical protein [Gemmatimonadota bacterium]
MFPREHGAYAQIGFPLVTALALGRPGPSAVLLVLAIVAVFLLHEPLMVLIGARGGRAKREAGSTARRRAAILTVVALAAGGAGLWLAPPMARATALIPLIFGALLVPLIFSRREKTAAGELLVAWSLSTTLVPVAVAAGVQPEAALTAAGVWAIAFSLSTLTVRAIIARAKKRQPSGLMPVIAPSLCAAAIALALYLAARDDFPALAAIAVVPTALVALAFGLLRVHPRNLRRMGWSLVASNLAVLAALLIGLR